MQWSTKKVHAFISSTSIEFQETDMNQGKNITQYILKKQGEIFFCWPLSGLAPSRPRRRLRGQLRRMEATANRFCLTLGLRVRYSTPYSIWINYTAMSNRVKEGTRREIRRWKKFFLAIFKEFSLLQGKIVTLTG